MSPTLVDILVNLSIKVCDTPYIYIVPDYLKDKVTIGSCVLIPFGKQTQVGYILKFREDKVAVDFELKEIIDVIDEPPLFNEEQLRIAYFLQNKYFCSFTQALHCILPVGRKFKLVKTVKLKNIKEKIIKGKEDYQRLINFLKEYPEEIELKKLLTKVDIKKKNIYTIINKLNKEEVIEVKTKLKLPQVRPKIKKTIILKNKTYNDEYKKLIEFVEQNNGIFTKTQIAKYTKTTIATINKLLNEGILAINTTEVVREPPYHYFYLDEPTTVRLTTEQINAIDKIKQKIDAALPDVTLLHGVTASGKTQIYIELANYVLAKDKQLIILLPEIAISTQVELIFKQKFKDKVAILHSRLPIGVRYDAYRRIKNNAAKIVIGARSAIFAPVTKLGLIIIDEEQDTSYKQDTDPRYNAKAVAIERAKFFSCPVVLGSATPTFEAYHKYNKIFLTKRIYDTPLPQIEIVDMRAEFKHGNKGLISNKLRFAMRRVLYNGEQAILFLNRRGVSHFVFCKDCGHVFYCPNCEVTLTLHQENNKLVCHYCNYNKELTSFCPGCSGYNLDYRSYGTEKLEQEVKQLFKKARILRMDKDTTRAKDSYYYIINAFRNKEADILVGTQMLTKGFHFPAVSLVGVINADVSLHIPDFRSAERTYQLLTQVAGRAGREKKQGYVIIQTYQPHHFVINAAKYQNYKKFYEYEIKYREKLSYPPFANLIDIIIGDEDKAKAKKHIHNLFIFIKPIMEKHQNVEIFAPTECILGKLKNKYRYHILIKTKEEINNELQECLDKFHQLNDGIKPIIDVDPEEIL